MPTRARIATVCQAGRCRPTVEENRAAMLDLLRLAVGREPDIVCLPEAFPSSGVPYRAAEETAESVPGPTVDAIGRVAKERRCYVVVPLHTLRGGRVYNSAVIVDRNGQVAGVYDKVHPVTTSTNYTEFEQGITPGAEYPVFDLDFGRVAVQICFDVGFPEGWRRLAEQGARLIFWPSAYNGGTPLQTYAAYHQCYVVTSVRADRSRIIDPCGTVLASTDSLYNVVWRDVNLDYALCHYDMNYSIPDRIEAAYPGRVEVRSHLDDGRFLVEPVDPSLSTAQLAEEFGFEVIDRYHDRHRSAYTEILSGRAPVPQRAAHGDRPIYAKE